MTKLERDAEVRKGLYTREPVFYCKGKDGTTYFGNHIHTLLEESGLPKQFNRGIIPTYLRYWSPFSADTFYTGVKRLLPGERLVEANGAVRVETFERPEFKPDTFASFDEAVAELGNILSDIMAEERKTSHASFLSSGVDSCLLASALPADTVVTAGYDEKKYDESVESIEIANELGKEIHVAKITAEDYFAVIPEAMIAREEPTGDSSYIPLYLAAREAAKHVDACCSGEGPDELFCGYRYYQNYMKNPQPGFWEIAHTCMKTKPSPEGANFANQYRDGFEQMQAFDLTLATACNLLPNLDAAGRGNGVEIRTPFVNRRLFDFALSIPPEWKVDQEMVKLVFRKAAEAYLPESIAQKPKRAFPVPTQAWMHEEPWKSMLRDTLKSKEAKQLLRGWIPKYYLHKFFSESSGKEATSSYWHPAWTMYALVVWYQHEFGGKSL